MRAKAAADGCSRPGTGLTDERTGANKDFLGDSVPWLPGGTIRIAHPARLNKFNLITNLFKLRYNLFTSPEKGNHVNEIA